MVEILDSLGRHLGYEGFDLGDGDEQLRLACFQVDEEQAIVVGELDVSSGVLAIAAVTVVGSGDAQAAEVDADRFGTVGGDGAHGVVEHLQFAFRVDVQDDGDEAPIAEVVVDDLRIGGGAEPVGHAALLEIPGPRLGQRDDFLRLDVEKRQGGGFVLGGDVIDDVGLQDRDILLGAAPGVDAIIAGEEVFFGPAGQGLAGRDLWEPHRRGVGVGPGEQADRRSERG